MSQFWDLIFVKAVVLLSSCLRGKTTRLEFDKTWFVLKELISSPHSQMEMVFHWKVALETPSGVPQNIQWCRSKLWSAIWQPYWVKSQSERFHSSTSSAYHSPTVLDAHWCSDVSRQPGVFRDVYPLKNQNPTLLKVVYQLCEIINNIIIKSRNDLNSLWHTRHIIITVFNREDWSSLHNV